MKKSERGFTLIELLIVVAIIGILAAIAIPNLLSAIQRAKQKRTLADMRAVATAWEARATDNNSYSAAGVQVGQTEIVSSFVWPGETVSHEQLTGILSPDYIKLVPQTDGWGQPYAFGLDEAIGESANTYGIRSQGRDGGWQGERYRIGSTNNFDCDIVFSNGSFIQWPEGLQGATQSQPEGESPPQEAPPQRYD